MLPLQNWSPPQQFTIIGSSQSFRSLKFARNPLSAIANLCPLLRLARARIVSGCASGLCPPRDPLAQIAVRQADYLCRTVCLHSFPGSCLCCQDWQSDVKMSTTTTSLWLIFTMALLLGCSQFHHVASGMYQSRATCLIM